MGSCTAKDTTERRHRDISGSSTQANRPVSPTSTFHKREVCFKDCHGTALLITALFHRQKKVAGARAPAVAEIRPPVTDDPSWPPTGPGTPWESEVDASYFDEWSEPAFS